MTTGTARERHDRVTLAATDTGGVISRAQLGRLGVTRHHICAQVAARRWALHGNQTVAVHRGELPTVARWWRAVWEVGVHIAALDGVTALQAAGVTQLSCSLPQVSVVHTARIGRLDGIGLRKIRRRVDGELMPAGIPRVRPAFAAVRAAHWAVSDRQASLFLLLPVQQRVITSQQLLDAATQVRGRTRRAFITMVVADLADGAHSLGELDFAWMCRRRGLPEPERQVVRRGPRGRVYLDVRWARSRLVVEIDGAGHRMGLSVTSDNLRQNAVVLSGDLVLRIDLIGMRLMADLFMDQVAAGLGRGWR